jgi:hypothetical protein
MLPMTNNEEKQALAREPMPYNRAAALGLDAAIKGWAALKYDLYGIDVDHGEAPLYRKPLDEWDDGDADMLFAWDSWLHDKKDKTEEELRLWVRIATSRGVDVRALRMAYRAETTPEEEPSALKAVFKGLLLLGGVFAVRYFFAKPKPPEPVGLPVPENVLRDALSTTDDYTAPEVEAMPAPKDMGDEY